MNLRTVLTARSVALDSEQSAAAFAAASLLLRYPDDSLVESLEGLTTLCHQLPKGFRDPYVALCEDLSAAPLLDAQARYVATFDLQRRCCLYLSYYLNGDTRRRGTALWTFQDAYLRAGREVLHGELPDFLPALLEFAATGGELAAVALMNEHRAGILVLLEALEELDSPYAGVVAAIDSILPPRDDRAITEAERLVFDGPPSELVGIDDVEAFEPYGSGSSVGCGSTQPSGPTAVPVHISEKS
ncbi:MAG: nitrate reductase molybdenum cofactor assembly chaperone [Actinomycetales bacterium]|nr:nitrate reductase molybdenum cofactor assembly chaperone [Actinomycetales bacterium]